MTAWCHLPTIFKQRYALLTAVLGMLFVAFITTLLFANVSHAVTSTNRTINFQGRLLGSSGAVVPDGYYNIQFKIYQGGSGAAAGNPDGSLDWTENHINNGGTSGVKVTGGFFSVSLGSITPFGSSIDWDQSNLWLSMNVAGSTSDCTAFGSGSCVGDGEMLPMKQVTATPYAINAGSVGGKTADNFTQLGQGVQTDSSNTSSIFINKTGSGNVVQLQASGNDVFAINNTGDITMGSATNHSISVAQATSGAGTSLTISGGKAAASSGQTGGDLILQGGATTDGSYSGAVIVKANTYDSPGAFQVQNAGGLAVFNVDTTGGQVTIQGTSIYRPNLVIQAAVGQSASQMLEFRDSNGNRTADIGSDANQNLSFGISAIGGSATGGGNLGFGAYAAGSLTSGYYNIALGGNSLSANQDGADNIAIGQAAAGSNVSGSHNVALGWSAYGSGTGSSNVALGYESLSNSGGGGNNVAVGAGSGYRNTTGSNNTFLGTGAGNCHYTGQFCTSPTIQGSSAIGYEAQVQASYSLVLGSVDDPVNVGIGTTVPLNTFSVSSVAYTSGTASQSGNTVTGTGTTWDASMIGDELVFSNGDHGIVTGFTDATHLTLSTYQTETDQAYRLHYAGLNVANNGNVGIGTTNPGSNMLSVAGSTQIQASSSTALQVQDGNGNSMFNVDTTANTISIGDGVANGAPTLLTLDQASSAPTTTSLGSMYYDTTVGKVQCYQANGWGSCSAAPNTYVTISPEYSGAVMNGADIGTISSDICSDALNINNGSSGQPTVCGPNETHNFYRWTSGQATAQTRSIFVTYKLPSNFKSFVSGSTSLLGRTDSTNSSVTYQIYRDNGTTLTSCGSVITVSSGSQSTWQKVAASGSADPSSCSFAAGDSLLMRINLAANTNANAYVSDISFVYSNN